MKIIINKRNLNKVLGEMLECYKDPSKFAYKPQYLKMLNFINGKKGLTWDNIENELSVHTGYTQELINQFMDDMGNIPFNAK